jgi:hypothetical protein
MQERVVRGFSPPSSASVAVPATVLRRIARETTVRTSHLGPIPVFAEFFTMLLGEEPVPHHPSLMRPTLPVVDLLDQGAIVGDSPGQYRSRAYFRFRLRDLHRGDLGGP